ncbi:hypothetical protein [Galactobacter caseinivorans]|uniref:Uncharacterized protein n=1 Tax=Galactobacter caseinivorans TaxID=2676123 RepID=A0A496PKK2_9MICC|nr:hypothetical protein [Galactobacter caseinivorans]RKW70945.1 hypothetical protein DWQ67_03805 [Galactobacter caseinivorans]
MSWSAQDPGWERDSPGALRDQAALAQVTQRRGVGEKVAAFRGPDGELRVYSRAQAGTAWLKRATSREVGSLGGLWTLLVLEIVLFVALGSVAISYRRDSAVTGLMTALTLVVLATVVWLVVLLRWEIRSRRLRREAGLPAPVGRRVS